MTFSNPEFLPLVLTAKSWNCSGQQLARVAVPEAVDDGLITVQW